MNERESYCENDYCEYWIQQGVVFEIFKPNLKRITHLEAEIIVRDRLRVSNGVTMPIYIELGKATSMNRAANRYFSTGDAMLHLSATAILVKDQLEKLGASMYITIFPPSIPTKFFTDRNEALQWLEKFKPKPVS